MLARLCIIVFLFSSFTCAEKIQQDKQEIEVPEKYEGYSNHIRWFASLGVGGLYNCNIDNVFLDNYLSMGFIIPYSDRISHYFSLDFDSVFLNDWGKKYADEYVNTMHSPNYTVDQILTYWQYRSSGGYALNFSVNYNFGYSVFYTKGYRIEALGGIGLGGQFEFLFSNAKGGEAKKKNQSFLLNANFGIRNVFFENHAFDFMLKTNLLNTSQGIADCNGGFIFSFNYTFLKI